MIRGPKVIIRIIKQLIYKITLTLPTTYARKNSETVKYTFA